MTVKINDKDAKQTWGIVFDSSSVSALMTPPPMKAYIEDASRLEDGKRVIVDNAKVESRNVTLTFSLMARNETEFFSRYNSFCEEIQKGLMNIELSILSNVVFKCVYKSCSQFTQYNNRLAKFSLKVEEPNPKDRIKS